MTKPKDLTDEEMVAQLWCQFPHRNKQVDADLAHDFVKILRAERLRVLESEKVQNLAAYLEGWIEAFKPDDTNAEKILKDFNDFKKRMEEGK